MGRVEERGQTLSQSSHRLGGIHRGQARVAAAAPLVCCLRHAQVLRKTRFLRHARTHARTRRGGSSIQREKTSLGILAGVAGAVAGNAIERMTTKEEAFEIIVQLRNGDRRAIVQAKGSETLLAGDAVIIVTSGNKVRVTRAPR